MTSDGLALAQLIRDLLVVASGVTIAVHIGLVGLHWLRTAGYEMSR